MGSLADEAKPPTENGRPSRKRTAVERPQSDRPRAAPEPSPLNAPTLKASAEPDETKIGGAFELGTVLAERYRILELLGEGGMGAVYRARDLTLGEDVAVKLLAAELANDPERVAYFRNEVLLARRVTHPNVCRLHDIASENGNWFITMEYIVGESLADKLRREEPPATEAEFAEVERIFRDVAAGLAAAHEVGVVHRDLKPDNIMLSADSTGIARAVVADFGIAVELNQLGIAAVDRAGTRGYMSPEQAAGKEIDARTDVFALGVLGHRMLTGEIPWNAPTRVEATDVGGPAPDLPLNAPTALRSVIDHCLAQSPENRPRDANAVLAELSNSSSPALPVPGSSRRPIRTVAFAALAVAAVVVAFFALRPATVQLNLSTPRVVIEAVNSSALDAKLRWFDDAFARRLVNELGDAWGISARTSDDRGDDARASDIAVAVNLRRSDAGQLVATLRSRRHGTNITQTATGETFQGLAVACAKTIVMSGVPKSLRRPLDVELELTGIQSPEAWRDWRRAQRASLRQEWPRARLIANRALKSDPDCIPCLVELAWSFGETDAARIPPWLRAIELAKTQPLSTSWRLIIDFMKARAANDDERVAELVVKATSPDRSPRERAYFSYRSAAALWFARQREAAVPKLEWHVEKFPGYSGIAKLLAEHYLDIDGSEASAQALRYANHAVAVGPDDLGARSQLARALLRLGRRGEALAQVAIIESAEPEEKQQALAGGERTNSLFDLYVALEDWRGAGQSARRLYNGSPQQQGTAADSLSYLAHLRGDHVAGKRLSAEAIEKFDENDLTVFRASSRRRGLEVDFALGDSSAVLGAIAQIPAPDQLPHYAVLAAVCRSRLARGAKRRRELGNAQRAIEALPATPDRELLELMLAIEKGDWPRALSHEKLVSAGRRYISAYAFLGIAAEKSGDLERAAAWHERLADHRFAWTEPIRAQESRLEAARLRDALGDKKRAIAHYKAYIRLVDKAPPTHAGVARARAALKTLR